MDDMLKDEWPVALRSEKDLVGSDRSNPERAQSATAVSEFRLHLTELIGAERFALWFGPQTLLTYNAGRLTITAPSTFFQDWLRKNFRKEIEQVVAAVWGPEAILEIVARPALTNSPGAIGSASETMSPVASNPKVAASASGSEPLVSIPLVGHPSSAVTTGNSPILAASAHSSTGPMQAAVVQAANERRRRFSSLEQFVVSDSNRLAYAAARRATGDSTAANPLVLYGPTGTGKTHLLEGIWGASRRARPSLSALLISAEQFTSQFLGALHGSGLPSFRRKYRGLNLLLIDDAQFFVGKRATLGELLYTIDVLVRDGRQLVFAFDRAPEALPDLGPELVARLQGGLCCPLESPDEEARRGITRRFCKLHELDLSSAVQEFVADNVASHARALAGALHRLHAAQQMLGKPLSLDAARQIVAEFVGSQRREVRLADIEVALCEVFGLEPKTLQSSAVGKRVNPPRMLAMYLARKHTRAALKEIGSFFGHRSHSTVIAAQKRVDTWVAAHENVALSDRQLSVDEVIRRVEATLLVG